MRHPAAILLALAFASAAPAASWGDTYPPGTRPSHSIWSRDYAYGDATAHKPGFEDKKLWPHLSGKEYFLASTWPATRLLVWSKPGKDGCPEAPLDARDPANWTDAATGKPATALPDADTDILLPDAATPYKLDVCNPGHGKPHWGGKPIAFRHVTIGRNAGLLTANYAISGNLWVRRGGWIGGVVGGFTGDRHAFVRNDNELDSLPDLPTFLCQYLLMSKARRDISVEFLGQWHTGDEFQCVSGTLIIAPDSLIEMGREAYPYIEKDAVIALLDNAYFAKWTIDLHACDMQVRGGSLQAGLPDRPISRSAVFRVGHKNHTAASFVLTKEDDGSDYPPKRQMAREVGMALHAGSSLRCFSADPAKARLVVAAIPSSYPVTFLRPVRGQKIFAETLADQPMLAKLYDWVDALPTGIDIAIANDVTVDGVEFRGLRTGGLMLEGGKTQLNAWKNVIFGVNAGPTEQLLAPMPSTLARSPGY